MIEKKYLCAHLWNHLVVDFRTCEFRMCCKTSPIDSQSPEFKLKNQDIFLNSDVVLQARKEMLSGEKPEICRQCWRIEENNLPSHRTSYEEWEKSVKATNYPLVDLDTAMPDDLIRSKYPINLDIQLGNTCDLKCVYCNERFSTSWQNENKKSSGQLWFEGSAPTEVKHHIEHQQKFHENFWKVFDETKYSYERIAFLGGEPLISPNFYQTLENLIQKFDKPSPKLHINIITNLNTPPVYFDRFMELLPKLTDRFRVAINVSMEAWDKQAEYIRYGVNFNRFLTNFEKLLSLKLDLQFITITSINVLCLSTLEKYIRWIHARELKYNRRIEIHYNIVNYPEFLSLDMADENAAHFLEPLIDFLETEVLPFTTEWYWIRYHEHIKQVYLQLCHKKSTDVSSKRREDFKRFVKEIKERRGANFQEVFPESFYQNMLT